jgi:hypothetical protein
MCICSFGEGALWSNESLVMKIPIFSVCKSVADPGCFFKEHFTPKIVTKLSKSGIRKKTYSRFRIQGSKRHRIPQHWSVKMWPVRVRRTWWKPRWNSWTSFNEDSSPLLYAIHCPFWWRILKKTILFSRFKKSVQKNPQNKMRVENQIKLQSEKTWVYALDYKWRSRIPSPVFFFFDINWS